MHLVLVRDWLLESSGALLIFNGGLNDRALVAPNPNAFIYIRLVANEGRIPLQIQGISVTLVSIG